MTALLDAFGIKGSLLLAQAVNFGIVLVALWYFLYKPIAKILAERQQMVAQGVADAAEAQQKLAQADTEAAGRVGAADQAAEGIVKSARSEAAEERAKMLREAEARATQIRTDAESRAAEESARVRRESEKDIARLALIAAEKVLQKHD
jgi:F-type H+-transporting ATPase subunit b